jgi:hypothetical protein
LEPFYKMHGDRRYEVYWDRFTPAQWQAREAEYQANLARQKEIEARTVDSVTAGEEQNERNHKMKGENTDTRDINERMLRFASTNGWFSWEMKVLPGQPQELNVAFGGGRGGSSLDIYVDNTKLATEQLTGFGRQPGSNSKVYPLSAELLKGKGMITVKFQAPSDSRGGSVYSVRIMKPAANK